MENTPMEEQQNLPEQPFELQAEQKRSRKPNHRLERSFGFWRGLQTTVGVALLVATLFTIWTPGSLIESSLEARMALALQAAASGVEDLAEEDLDPEQALIANKVGIVAGHYGADDPGAVCANGVTEVELNLEIATLVQKLLTDQGYQVDLLEEFDSRLYDFRGAVVVSLHLDSCEYINDLATGFKVAAALANQDPASSQRLTACLSQRYGEITGLPYHAGSVTDDMTKYYAFNEIAPQTNAAIIEAGFMNRDYQFITEETDKIAEGIVAGILCFLNNEPIQPTQVP
jgi:N-acetylmuramoyl-L-alanine amidase